MTLERLATWNYAKKNNYQSKTKGDPNLLMAANDRRKEQAAEKLEEARLLLDGNHFTYHEEVAKILDVSKPKVVQYAKLFNVTFDTTEKKKNGKMCIATIPHYKSCCLKQKFLLPVQQKIFITCRQPLPIVNI